VNVHFAGSIRGGREDAAVECRTLEEAVAAIGRFLG